MENINLGKSYTVNHYLAEKIPRNAIYGIIRCAENDFGYKRKAGSGHIAKNTNKIRLVI